MSTHNICFYIEIRKYYVDTPSYLEQCIIIFFTHIIIIILIYLTKHTVQDGDEIFRFSEFEYTIKS